MVDRICISINNKCNLNCKYCHFHEKSEVIQESEMNILKILNNVKEHIKKYNIKLFKIGFVGNGEPLINFNELKEYIDYISDELNSGVISAYTITNGTCVSKEMLLYFKKNNINVGFSIDGVKEIHNKWRCGTFDKVMQSIELYQEVNGKYPSMNCTVGKDVLNNDEETISFFEKFHNRITFSRMIGKNGISMEEFKSFMDKAIKRLNVRTGGYDCTMYGGLCGAGINNYFYSNGNIYLCGNCIDIDLSFPYETPLDEVDFGIKDFNRKYCFKESC